MFIPDWLSGLTNAAKFADGGRATFGDALQGIGSNMMDHYRGGGGRRDPSQPVTPIGPRPMPQPGETPIINPGPDPMTAKDAIKGLGETPQVLPTSVGPQGTPIVSSRLPGQPANPLLALLQQRRWGSMPQPTIPTGLF